jgi:hypothetical protein
MCRLLEGLEERRQLHGGHADAGVPHLEAQEHAVLGHLPLRDRQHDLVDVGELDRVRAVVGEDLSEPQRVADQVSRDVRIDAEQERDPLLARGGAEQGRQVVEHCLEREVDGLEAELARLDLRCVEDVVDDSQRRRAARSIFDRWPRWRSSRSVWSARWLMPIIAFMGVRISWLIVARKSLSARLARSAALRAASASWIALASSAVRSSTSRSSVRL